MGNIATTYDLDKARQVLLVTEKIMQQRGQLGAIALRNGLNSTLFPRAKATKYEKKVFRKGRITTTIATGVASGYFDATAKTLNVGSTVNLLVGDILRFEVTASGKRKGTLQVMVVEVTDTTNIKAVKVGGADVALTTSESLVYVSNANPEASEHSIKRPINKPTTIYNFTQIIKEGREISGSALSVDTYSEANTLASLRAQVLEDFTAGLNGLCSGTSRVEVTNPITGDVSRVAGGLQYFARNLFSANGDYSSASTANVIDKSGSALTQTMIDDGFQYAIQNGGSLNAILCSPKQARAISGFDASKINIFLQDVARGGAVQVLKSPIKVNGNQIDSIYVDTEMVQDEVIMFNESKIALVPMINRDYVEGFIGYGSSEFDGAKISVLGEWTFLFENADINSYILTNLG